MKKMFIIFLFLSACGGASSSSDSTTKYLASNIIFSSAEANTTATRTIDTETQILASNVVVDRTSLGLVADNLQDALTEIVPSLDAAIVGTWELTQIYGGGTTVTSENDISDFTRAFGTITFNDDGTFISNLDSDEELSVFASCEDEDSDHENYRYQYQIIANQIISLKVTANVVASPGSVYFSILPLQITNIQADSISFNAAGSFYIFTKQ